MWASKGTEQYGGMVRLAEAGLFMIGCGPLLSLASLFTPRPSAKCYLVSFMIYISCPSPGADSPIEQVRVLGLLHEELHGPGPMGALSTLAHTEVTLSGKMGQTSASILCRRPQQRATYQVRKDNREDWIRIREGPMFQPEFLLL